MVTKLRQKLIKKWRIQEVFNDSQLNQIKKLELYAVVGSCMAIGFPLADFVLQMGVDGAFKSRVDFFTGSLHH